ncbi:MAG: AI-2E family transporter [Treponema sp.]|jgi:predicted PurR-regulated permease PerM|nr:AI-2E family transporter [Treponema sp.]
MSEQNLPERKVQNVIFGVILIALFALVCRLFSPFFTVFLWSILFYILFSPLHRLAMKKVNITKRKGNILKNLFAALFAIMAVLIILIPITFVAIQFFYQIVDLFRAASDILSTQPLIIDDILESISDFIRGITFEQITISAADIRSNIMSFIRSGLQEALQFSSSLAGKIGSFLITLALMIFCLFFFFLDGNYLSKLTLHIIPIRKEYLSTLVSKFTETTRNLFFGYILVAFVQAFTAFIIFNIFHIKGSFVFASLTFICVFIPMIGGGLVWIPLGIAKIIEGPVSNGIIFMILAGVSISLIDNIIRPFFLQDRIKLHPLIIFFSILGGISILGFNGLILGPMIVILFLTVLDLFLVEHGISPQEITHYTTNHSS